MSGFALAALIAVLAGTPQDVAAKAQREVTPRAAALGAGRVAVSLPVWRSTYDWPGAHGSSGWDSVANSADPLAYSFERDLGGRRGLWLWLTGDRHYVPGYGEWRFEAPGTTRIASADIELSYANKILAHHCIESGLRVGGGSRDVGRYCNPPAEPATQEHWAIALADQSDKPTAKQAYVRVEMPACQKPIDHPSCPKWVPAHDPLKNEFAVRLERVDMVLVDDDLPVPASSGPFRELEDRYIDGRQAYDVTFAATDAGAGVSHVAFERVGAGDAFSEPGSCDPTHRTPTLGSLICPRAVSGSRSYDTKQLPEGAASFRAAASDVAGNRGAESPWRLFVDRTGPPQPYDFDVDLDDEADIATVSWVADEDPLLVDGSPGSGLSGWEHRFFHPRDGWSDWHRGVESVSVPDTYVGDEIRVEVRSLDAVDNGSALASAALTIPADDEEDEFEENLDDDEDDTYGVAASAGEREGMTLRFAALSPAQRRGEALAKVTADCSKPIDKIACYAAVRAACKVGGACRQAKQIACSQAKLYCPRADTSRVSLVERYQPTFRIERRDMFWPVALTTALKMRWDGRETCYVRDDECVAKGEDRVRRLLTHDQGTHDDHIDLPPQKDEIEDTFKSTTDALRIPRVDTDKPLHDPQWDGVYRSSRVYWYRGGGFGRGATARSYQYWTYHTFNYLDSVAGRQGKHEGDAEMVAVMLNADNQPVWSFMSRHGLNLEREARRFLWNDDRLQRNGDHVLAYAGLGSHAMYERCGKHARGGGAPDDHISCDTGDLLNFTFDRTRRISLGRTSWGCFGGRLGSGGGLPRFGSAPRAPLWQQDTFGGDRRPCITARPTAAAASRRDSEETEPISREQALEQGADPLLEAFSSCKDWHQAPTQPGLVVVACDQAQLDRFIASGLTDPGPGGAEIRGPGSSSTEVPAVYSGHQAERVAGVRIKGSGAMTEVYVARLAANGTLLEATLPGAVLPRGAELRLRMKAGRTELVAADGRTLASVDTRRRTLSATPVVKPPKRLKVSRRGGAVRITWRGQRGVRYVVGAGSSPAAAKRHVARRVAPRRSGRYAARVRVRRGDRWIAVHGVRRTGEGPPAAIRLPRRR